MKSGMSARYPLLLTSVVWTLTLITHGGCCRIQPLRAWPGLLDPMAPLPVATSPGMIPPQGYLEKGYSESVAPYTPPWNGQPSPYNMPPGASPYAAPAQYAAPVPPYAQTNVSQPVNPGVNAGPGAPVVAAPMSPDASLELQRSLEELHGKYSVVLEELAELRREVAANSQAISETSQQLDDTGEGLKKVRHSLSTWKKSLDGLEQRVRDDREAQLGTLDEVESLLLSILQTEERTRQE